MFGLHKDEESFLRSLKTSSAIQDFLDSLPFNFEKGGETCMSPRRVLREKKAHCLEGAMLAATALMLQGRKPLILSLKVDRRDDDHVVALFKEHGYWGAISKTNHAVLRYRDPVYRSIRELAMSYFNEYFLVSDGTKTMRGYSKPINLRKFGSTWVVEEKDLWPIAASIFDAPHAQAIPGNNRRFIKDAHVLERKAATLKA